MTDHINNPADNSFDLKRLASVLIELASHLSHNDERPPQPDAIEGSDDD